MSHPAAVKNTRWKDAWVTFLVSERSGAIQQDLLPSTHPVAADIRDIEDVLVNFDQITYGKGASVLKQLVVWVGLEEFLAGVCSHIAKYAWGDATLADLLAELEATLGHDPPRWTKVWPQEAGVNVLSPEIVEKGDVVGSFAVRQESDGRSSLHPHRIGMGGFDVIDGKLTRAFSAKLDIDGTLTEMPELAGAKRPALLSVNDEDLVYVRIRLDEKSLATTVEHLDAFEGCLARTSVVFAAWDMCRDGLMSATDYISIVLKALPDETDDTVLRFILGQLATAVTVYSTPVNRETLHSTIASRIFEILEGAEPSSDNRLQVASTAMRLAKTGEQLDRIAGWLEGEDLPEGYVVDAEARWGIVTALAVAGRIGETEIAEEYAKDSTSCGQIFSAQTRDALPDSAVHEEVWREIMGDFESNVAQRSLTLGSRRVTPESLIPYGACYYEDARAQWDNHSVEIARSMLEYAFPIILTGRTSLGVDIAVLGGKWLEDNKDAAPVCVRLVSELVDSTQRVVHTQAVNAGK